VVMKSFFDLDLVWFGGCLWEKLRLRWNENDRALWDEEAGLSFGVSELER
jgi:hypothetical protein